MLVYNLLNELLEAARGAIGDSTQVILGLVKKL